MPVTRSNAKHQQKAQKTDAKARSVAPVRKSSRLSKKDPVQYAQIQKAKLIPGGFVTAAKLLTDKEKQEPKTLPPGFMTAGQFLDQREGWTVVTRSRAHRNRKVTPATTEKATTEEERVNRFASLTQFVHDEGREKEIDADIGENLKDIFDSVASEPKPSSSASKDSDNIGQNLKDFIQSLASKDSGTQDDDGSTSTSSTGSPPPLANLSDCDSDSDDEAPLVSLLSKKRLPISQKHFSRKKSRKSKRNKGKKIKNKKKKSKKSSSSNEAMLPYLPDLDKTPTHSKKTAPLKPREPETDGSTSEETAGLLKKQVFSAEHKARAEMKLKLRSEQRKRRLAGLEKHDCRGDRITEMLLDLKDLLDEDEEKLKKMKPGESVAKWNEFDTFMDKQDKFNWLFKRYSEQLYPELSTLEPMSPDIHTPTSTSCAQAQPPQAQSDTAFDRNLDEMLKDFEYNSDDDRKLPAMENPGDGITEVDKVMLQAALMEEAMASEHSTDDDDRKLPAIENPGDGITEVDKVMEEAALMEEAKASGRSTDGDTLMEEAKASGRSTDGDTLMEEAKASRRSTDEDTLMEEPPNAQPWVGEIFLRDPTPLAKPRHVIVTPRVQRHDRGEARTLLTMRSENGVQVIRREHTEMLEALSKTRLVDNLPPDYEESVEDWNTKSIQQKLAHVARTIGHLDSDYDGLDKTLIEKLNSLKVIDSDDDLKSRDYQALLKISDKLMAGALSTKSERAYEKHQEKYIKFCKYYSIEWNKEESLASYLTALHHAYAGSTLWTIYSCIASLFRRHGIDVKKWAGVKAIMRTITKNHIYKKSSIFSGDDMRNIFSFLLEKINNTASDSDGTFDRNQARMTYIGINLFFFGLCRKQDVVNCLFKHVHRVTNNKGEAVYRIDQPVEVSSEKGEEGVSIGGGRQASETRNRKNKTHLLYDLPASLTKHVDEYLSLCAINPNQDRFLRNPQKQYTGDRVYYQNCGPNKIGGWARQFAGPYCLNKREPNKYTCHAWRRSATTQLVDQGASIEQLRDAGGWKNDTTVRQYVAQSSRRTSDQATMLDVLNQPNDEEKKKQIEQSAQVETAIVVRETSSVAMRASTAKNIVALPSTPPTAQMAAERSSWTPSNTAKQYAPIYGAVTTVTNNFFYRSENESNRSENAPTIAGTEKEKNVDEKNAVSDTNAESKDATNNDTDS